MFRKQTARITPDALYKMGERPSTWSLRMHPEGECGEPAIGLEYRAVVKFHDIIRAIQVIFKQAGAELCQAQVKLRLSKLASKFG